MINGVGGRSGRGREEEEEVSVATSPRSSHFAFANGSSAAGGASAAGPSAGGWVGGAGVVVVGVVVVVVVLHHLVAVLKVFNQSIEFNQLKYVTQLFPTVNLATLAPVGNGLMPIMALHDL